MRHRGTFLGLGGLRKGFFGSSVTLSQGLLSCFLLLTVLYDFLGIIRKPCNPEPGVHCFPFSHLFVLLKQLAYSRPFIRHEHQRLPNP